MKLQHWYPITVYNAMGDTVASFKLPARSSKNAMAIARSMYWQPFLRITVGKPNEVTK